MSPSRHSLSSPLPRLGAVSWMAVWEGAVVRCPPPPGTLGAAELSELKNYNLPLWNHLHNRKMLP